MMWIDIVTAAALVIFVGVTLYWLLTQPGTVADKLTTLERAARAARELVAAAEQLYQTGNLTADERLDYVSDKLSELFPDLPDDLIRLAIEAAVHWRNLAAGKQSPAQAEAEFGLDPHIWEEQPRIDYGETR